MDRSALIDIQNQITRISKIFELPAAIKQIQKQINEIYSVQKIMSTCGFTESNEQLIYSNFSDGVNDNEVVENSVISKEDAKELENDIRDFIDNNIITNSKLKLNKQQQLMAIYNKWAARNPIVAKIFSKIMDFIFQYVISFIISCAIAVSNSNAIKLHEEQQPNASIVCTIPENSRIELMPIDIPYYYYIIYEDPATGEIYDGYIAKRATKLNKIEVIGEYELPASAQEYETKL